jgi:Cu/Ag efflux protein CusF
MKSLIRSLMIVAVAALFVVPTLTRAEDAPKKEKAAKAEKADKSRQLTGEVEAVDAAAKTITLKSKKEGSKSFNVAADAKFGNDIKEGLSAVKVGDKVTVNYTEVEGKLVASKVGHAKPAAKKEGDDKKEKKAE